MLCHAAGVKGEAASGSNREGESTDAERRGGAARSGVEGPVMGLERRGCVCSALAIGQLETGGDPMQARRGYRIGANPTTQGVGERDDGPHSNKPTRRNAW